MRLASARDRSSLTLVSMKRRHRNVLAQIAAANPGTDWMDVEAILKHLGAEMTEGSGSTVTFFMGRDREHHLTIDRPHPRRHCGRGLVRRVRSFLRSTGNL